MSLNPFLNALSNYYRTHSKMSLTRVKNIFTSANINYIVMLYDYTQLGATWVMTSLIAASVKYQAPKSDELENEKTKKQKNKIQSQRLCFKLFYILLKYKFVLTNTVGSGWIL